MVDSSGNLHFLTKISFPPYCVATVDGNVAIVAGGGGISKTGVKNKFEVYSLHQNKQTSSARLVVSHDVGDHCISNMAAWAVPVSVDPLKESLGGQFEDFKENIDKGIIAPYSEILLAAGSEESCIFFKLTPKILCEEINGDCSSAKSPADQNVRRRGASAGPQEGGARHASPPAESVCTNTRITYLVEKLCTFQTVFSTKSTDDSSSKKKSPKQPVPPEDIYQKVCRVSPDRQVLLTGGTDGCIRLWAISSLPPKLISSISAHTRELDQLDVSMDNKHIVSICKGMRECCVWDRVSGKKVIQLAIDTPGVKYKFAWARYSCVEGQVSDLRLFTISNPVSGSKHPGMVSKWSGHQYTLEKRQKVDGVLSNLALSDDGRYLATGTMDGDIIIFVAFSLQKLQRVSEAHSTFVTGLDWLATFNRNSCIARGFSDASVLSISCDNKINITHVPRPTMVPLWLILLLTAFVLFCTFMLASYFDL